MQGKKITLKIHKKSRFQPNEKIFAESCSVRYKDLLWAKTFFGVIGTLNLLVIGCKQEMFHPSSSEWYISSSLEVRVS